MRLTIVIIAAALLAAGCSSSDGGDLLDSTESVCDEFAGFIQDGSPADQRSEVVSSIGEVIGNADDRVQGGHEALTNTVNSPAGAQQVADDMFAQACFDTGWDG